MASGKNGHEESNGHEEGDRAADSGALTSAAVDTAPALADGLWGWLEG
jgi:hypothetical protein